MPPIPNDADTVLTAYHAAFAAAFASTSNTTQSDVAGHRSACEAYKRLHSEVCDPVTLRSRVVIIIGRELLKDPGAFWRTAQHGRLT